MTHNTMLTVTSGNITGTNEENDTRHPRKPLFVFDFPGLVGGLRLHITALQRRNGKKKTRPTIQRVFFFNKQAQSAKNHKSLKSSPSLDAQHGDIPRFWHFYDKIRLFPAVFFFSCRFRLRDAVLHTQGPSTRLKRTTTEKHQSVERCVVRRIGNRRTKAEAMKNIFPLIPVLRIPVGSPLVVHHHPPRIETVKKTETYSQHLTKKSPLLAALKYQYAQK